MIIQILKDYWVIISFLGTTLFTALAMFNIYIKATKCSLRNDILQIYDMCKSDKKITRYQLQAIKYTSELYFKLRGNSFVHDIVDKVSNFDLID